MANPAVLLQFSELLQAFKLPMKEYNWDFSSKMCASEV